MKIFEGGLILFGILYLHPALAQTGQNAAQIQIQQIAAQDQQSAAHIPLVPNAAQIGQLPAQIRQSRQMLGQIRQSGAQFPIQQTQVLGQRAPIQQSRQTALQFPIQQSPIQQSRQTVAQFPIQQSPIQQSRQTAAQFPMLQSSIQQSRQIAAQFPIQQSQQITAQFPIQQSRQRAAQFPIQQSRQTSAQSPIQVGLGGAAQSPIQQFRQTGAQFPLGQSSQSGAQIGQIQQTGFQGPVGPYIPPFGQVRQNFRGPSSSDCQVESVDLSSDTSSISTEAKTVGLSIASKLDSFMRDKSVTDSGVAPVYNQNLDFLFILDSSGSIGTCEFLAAKNASKVVTEYINERNPISPTGSRVGLIEFSSPSMTHVMFTFGAYESLSAVTDAIDSITYDRGSTSTAIALNLAKTEFEQNGKAEHAKVAWVLTDGRSNTGGDPIPVASQLKNMGITVCAVAIGRGVNMAEINGIATENCVFQLPSFSIYREANKYAFAQKFGAKSSAQQKG